MIGILSLIFGIIGTIFSYWYVGIFLCVVGLVLGIVDLSDSFSDGKNGLLGLLMSILGGILSVFFVISDIDSGELMVSWNGGNNNQNESPKNDDFMKFHKEGWAPDQEENEVSSSEQEEERIEDEEEKEISNKEEEKKTPYWVNESKEENAIEEYPKNATVEQKKQDSELDEGNLYAESMEEDSKEDKVENKDSLLTVLQDILGEDTGNKTFDILVNQIGFTDVVYIGKNSVGTNNFDFQSNECDFTVTAFKDDDVYRIFRPSKGTVFYENGEIKNTIEDYESKKIGSDDRISYYVMAQEIVSGALKNPKSAKFPSIVTHPEEIAMQRKGNIVAVKSYVESKNDFGVEVRNDWLVEFEIVDVGTYSYNLLYANMGGEEIGEFMDLD